MKTYRLSVLAAAVLASGCALLNTADQGSSAAAASAPKNLAPAVGEQAILTLPAIGIQIYECKPNAQGTPTWSFVAPQADLFDLQGRKLGTHYAGPTWELADGSKIKGTVRERSDATAPGAIPWLLLGASSTGGAGRLAQVSNLQRLNTRGGVAPADGCSSADLGKKANVYYTADYVFFAKR